MRSYSFSDRGHQTAPSSSAIESASAPRRPSSFEIASGSEQRPKASSPSSEMTRDPQGVPVGRLGEGAELLDGVTEDHCTLPGPGHVRDREGELARADGQPGHALIEGPEAAERMEEGVERVRVVVELSLLRLRVDQAQSLLWIRLGDRQVHVHERVSVAELALLLLAGVQADGALDSEVLGDPAGLRQPAAKRTGDDRQDDVVHGGALAARCGRSASAARAGSCSRRPRARVRCAGRAWCHARGAAPARARPGAGPGSAPPRPGGGRLGAGAACVFAALPARRRGGSGVSTSTSQSSPAASVIALTPSAIAWWMRPTIAARPPVSGRTSSRQSGRVWSSRSERSSPTAGRSSSSESGSAWAGVGDVPVEVDLVCLDPGGPPEPEAGLRHPLAEPGEGVHALRRPARAAAGPRGAHLPSRARGSGPCRCGP